MGISRDVGVPQGWEKFWLQQRKLWAAGEEGCEYSNFSHSEIIIVSPRLPSDLPLIKHNGLDLGGSFRLPMRTHTQPDTWGPITAVWT